MSRVHSSPQIAVLGGGIGGLAAAAFLHRAGLAATVYEQATALTEVGAGLVVAPNAARLLRRLGVLDAFREDAVALTVGWEFRRWEDGTVLSAEDLAVRCEELYGEETYTAHRAHLLDVIRSAVSPGCVRLGKRAVSVSLDHGRPRVLFADGTVITPEVVIGADGIHSVVREFTHGASAPAPSGIMAYRALVPADRAPEFSRRAAQTLWIGPEHHLVHYPISGGRLINLVAFAPSGGFTGESWTATASVEEMLAEFAGWDRRLVELVEIAGTPGRWALLDRAPLERWSRGPITLLGDAAHPFFPFFAQGAAQAMEDAAVLAACLAESPGDPEAALGEYERRRIPRTTRIQTVSHGRSHVNHLPDGPEQRARDAGFAAADPLVANGWIYSYTPEDLIAAGP